MTSVDISVLNYINTCMISEVHHTHFNVKTHKWLSKIYELK